MSRFWPAWGVVGAVILTVLAAPPLREQARMQWAVVSHGRLRIASGLYEDGLSTSSGLLDLSWACFAGEVLYHAHASDSQTIAGIYVGHAMAWKIDHQTREGVLETLADSPSHLAAALRAAIVAEDLKLGSRTLYPSDFRRLLKTLRDEHDHLPAAEVARFRHALSRWEKADPDNGLPLALRAWLLYGLRRDSDARAAWLAAAVRPRCGWPGAGLQDLGRRALVRRGLPELESGVLMSLGDTIGRLLQGQGGGPPRGLRWRTAVGGG